MAKSKPLISKDLLSTTLINSRLNSYISLSAWMNGSSSLTLTNPNSSYIRELRLDIQGVDSGLRLVGDCTFFFRIGDLNNLAF